jgi:hypothetical protein
MAMYYADKRALERAEKALSELQGCIAELDQVKSSFSLAMFSGRFDPADLRDVALKVHKTLLRHFPEEEIAALPIGLGLLDLPPGLDSDGIKEAIRENFERAKDILAELITMVEKTIEGLKSQPEAKKKKAPWWLPPGGGETRPINSDLSASR